MKQAKIKATKQYHDVELDKLIQIGEEYTVSLERAETIISKGFAILVETIEEAAKEEKEVAKPATKKRATRKKKK
jgi:hypothetical protein